MMFEPQNRINAIISYRIAVADRKAAAAMDTLNNTLLSTTSILWNAAKAFGQLEEALGAETILEDFSDN